MKKQDEGSKHLRLELSYAKKDVEDMERKIKLLETENQRAILTINEFMARQQGLEKKVARREKKISELEEEIGRTRVLDKVAQSDFELPKRDPRNQVIDKTPPMTDKDRFKIMKQYAQLPRRCR